MRNKTALVASKGASGGFEYQPFGLGIAAGSMGAGGGQSSPECSSKPIYAARVKAGILGKSRGPLLLNHPSQIRLSSGLPPESLGQAPDLLMQAYDDHYQQYMNVTNHALHSLVDKRRGAMPAPRYQLRSNMSINSEHQGNRIKPRTNGKGVSDALLIAQRHPEMLRVNGGKKGTLSSQPTMEGHQDGATLDYEQANKATKDGIDEHQERRRLSAAAPVTSQGVEDSPQLQRIRGLNEARRSEEMRVSSLIRSSQQNRSVQISQTNKG